MIQTYQKYKDYASMHKDQSTTRIFRHFNGGIRRQEGLRAIAEGKGIAQKIQRKKYIPKKYKVSKQPQIEVIEIEQRPSKYTTSHYVDNWGRDFFIKTSDQTLSLEKQKQIIMEKAGYDFKPIKSLRFVSREKHDYQGDFFIDRGVKFLDIYDKW